MSTSIERDSKLLGHSIGSATTRLRKLLLFDFAGQLKRLTCFRCGKEVTTVEDFSIEHTVPWRSAVDPASVFYDLSTIQFSHLRCNLGAFSRDKTECPKGHPYSTENTYLEADGQRRCRECNQARSRAAYYRRKET
jgi:hypothetical protein